MSSPAETRQLDRLAGLYSELWRLEPAATAVKWSQGQWQRARHLDFLSHKLAEMARRPLRLIVSLPPRHGKSELVSHWLPVWMVSNWPEKRVMEVSYEAEFAASWGRKARDTIMANLDLGVKIRPDISSTSVWETEQGGGMVTAGVGGPITGRGADLMILDDPIKNWEEAHSPTIRENHWNWYRSTARPRLEPGASIVVMMARWHREDLAGKLLAMDPEQWEYVRLPALADTNDPVGRRPGEALWPQRYDVEALVKIKGGGDEAWASLYQQRPEEVAGDCYFDVPTILALLKQAKDGEVFKPYVTGRRYAAGIDPGGQGGGDAASLSILDCQTGEYAVDWTDAFGVSGFAARAFKILETYGFPLTQVEPNGVGLATIEVLKGLGFPPDKLVYQDDKRTKVGMPMTGIMRDRILVDFAMGVNQGAYIVYSKKALEEMLNFLKGDKPEAAPGMHDDRVFAMAWANWCSKQVSVRKLSGVSLMER